MKCPICKKNALFVGVHDDEGNYHGLLGCDYESDPWSGLSYALHHEGWGECPLCTDGAYSTMGGMLFDTAEEAIASLFPPNEPLTIEQLREMGGEPVYLVAQKYGISEWNVLNGMDEIVLAYDEPVVRMKAVVPGIKFINGRVLGVGSYGEDWLAYRRPPEGES